MVKEEKITNYADDTTPYAIEKSIDKLIDTLEVDINIILTWFDNNYFKLNYVFLSTKFYPLNLMKILVCISHVPDTTSKINFTENNSKFDKNGVQFVINPND